jgi:YihY family inner membrane protein
MAVMLDPLGFIARVISGFRSNQGFLLSGAIAYYMLLSIVPIFALILVVLSQIVDKQLLLETMRSYLELVALSETDALISQIVFIMEEWKLIGIVGLVILVFFSSLAFTVIENAISVIFHHRVRIHRRHFLISAILPFCYIITLALGLFLVSLLKMLLFAADGELLEVFGFTLLASSVPATLFYGFGLFGEALLLTLLYLLMPVGQLAFSHAFIGGVTATFLWELTRHFLLWYFSTLSFVNVIYGSFASVIIILLSFEIGAIILLLGAQVIAEFECTEISHDKRSGWHT